MIVHPQTTAGTASPPRFAERRREPRLAHPFRATVYGADGAGEHYEFETALDDISSGGLHVTLPELFEEGTELLVVCHLAKSALGETPAPLVALHGTVVRAEANASGGWGHGLKFRCTHFL